MITSLKRTFSALWHHEPEAFWAKAWSELARTHARRRLSPARDSSP